MERGGFKDMAYITRFISRKTVFLIDRNEFCGGIKCGNWPHPMTLTVEDPGGSSVVRVFNWISWDSLQQENHYPLKDLDHRYQTQLKIHYLNNFKCGYQKHVLGRMAFSPAPRI